MRSTRDRTARRFDIDEVARERLYAQHLTRPRGTPAEVVTHLLAVQAQDYAGARWAVGQRTRSARDADVEQAFDAGAIRRRHEVPCRPQHVGAQDRILILASGSGSPLRNRAELRHSVCPRIWSGAGMSRCGVV